MNILVSAGEASGDIYASALVGALRPHLPDSHFYGCTGPRMRAAGVETVVDAANLNVVGLFEVVRHIPRIYGEFRRLAGAARERRPDLAILTDSPDFHLRLAKKLRRQGVPVVYLIAPQVWAWRTWRVRAMRRDLDRVLCIFPFEKEFFERRGMRADYLGHPLTRIVRSTLSRDEFRARHGLDASRPMFILLAGSRPGEIARHVNEVLLDCAGVLLRQRPDAQLVLAAPAGTAGRMFTSFTERLASASIQLIEGETWDAIAAADVALAASGTVTIEAALLGTPMAVYYKVSPLSWRMGKFLVNVPYYSMVNLVAGREVAAELIQDACTPERLAAEGLKLLPGERDRTRVLEGLAEVRSRLQADRDPMDVAAEIVLQVLDRPKVDRNLVK